VCDTDNRCGYLNGDGACNSSSTFLCRSGICSTAGVCRGSQQCYADSDCQSYQFCNVTGTSCLGKYQNSQPLPVDSRHNPVFNGSCTIQIGTIVCVSGVCDTDGICGYKTGTNCTSNNVCRSEKCGSGGFCLDPSGCVTDLDCNNASFCLETTDVCTLKIVSGFPIPTDVPTHLNGTCTPQSGIIACVAGVCSGDNNCGLRVGEGPCRNTYVQDWCRNVSCDYCVGSGASSTCQLNTQATWCTSPTPTPEPTPTPTPTPEAPISTPSPGIIILTPTPLVTSTSSPVATPTPGVHLLTTGAGTCFAAVILLVISVVGILVLG